MVNIIGEPYNSEMGLSVIFLHAVDIVFNGAVYVVVSYQEKNGQVNLWLLKLSDCIFVLMVNVFCYYRIAIIVSDLSSIVVNVDYIILLDLDFIT